MSSLATVETLSPNPLPLSGSEHQYVDRATHTGLTNCKFVKTTSHPAQEFGKFDGVLKGQGPYGHAHLKVFSIGLKIPLCPLSVVHSHSAGTNRQQRLSCDLGLEFRPIPSLHYSRDSHATGTPTRRAPEAQYCFHAAATISL